MTCDSRAVKLTIAALLIVCACSGSSPRPTPPSNQPTEAEPGAPVGAPEVTVSIAAAAGLAAGTGALAGSIASAGEMLIGATVVATSPALQGSHSAITDEQGRFTLSDLPAGAYVIDVYYEDVTFQHPVEIVDGKRTELRVPNWRFEQRGEVILLDK